MKEEILNKIRSLCNYFIKDEYWNESRLPKEILEDALSTLSHDLDKFKVE